MQVNKAAVVAKISQYLNSQSLTHSTIEDGCTMGFDKRVFKTSGGVPATVELHSSGVIIWHFSRIGSVGVDNDHIDELGRMCEAVSYVNDILVAGRFAIDPKDGELTFELPQIVADQMPSHLQLEDGWQRSAKTLIEYVPFFEGVKSPANAGKSVKKLFLDNVQNGKASGQIRELLAQLNAQKRM